MKGTKAGPQIEVKN